MDSVDKIVGQWNRERPELDVAPMSLIGRVLKIARHLNAGMEKTFAAHGLNFPSFDVLATLRRNGPPFALSPSDLMEEMMITSGTMTNRIDQLVKQGYVERVPSQTDRRSFLIRLTKDGRTLIDTVVSDHVATQKQLVAGLSEAQREEANALLSVLLSSFEDPQES